MTDETKANKPDDLAILQGKKVSARFYANAWDPSSDDPEPGLETRWFAFSMSHMAEIEREFTSAEALNESIVARPIDTMSRVFAILLGCDQQTAAARMVREEFPNYWAGIEAAFGIALGDTEEMAGKVVVSRLAFLRAVKEQQARAYQTTLGVATASSQLSNGSGRGPARRSRGRSPSSGD